MATIFKKRGTWFLDYYLNGKRIRKSLKTSSKKIAQLALHDLEVKLVKNDLGLTQKNIKVEDYLEEFLAWKKPRIAETTFNRIKSIFKLHFMPFLEKHAITHLKQITPWHLEKYVTKRASLVKNNTINTEIVPVKNFLKVAVKWNYLQKNPADDIKRIPVKDQKTPRYLSEDEIETLLANSNGIIRLMALTAINTGLRKKELLNLEWQDLDFQRNMLKVAHDERRQTKSKRTRFVPIKENLKQELLNHKNQAGSITPTQKVFLSSRQTPMQYFNAGLRKVYKRIGIKNAGIHTLRHTFASHLVMNGVDLYTVSKLLGHSDVKITQIYAHLAPDHLKAAVERLPDFGHPEDTHEKILQISSINPTT